MQDKILGASKREVRNFFMLLLKVRYRSPMESLSTSPLHGGDGLLGKLTENLEGEEEGKEDCCCATWWPCSDSAVPLIHQGNPSI